ncbi:MAG: glycogen debranching protein [Eudoraea sp.]
MFRTIHFILGLSISLLLSCNTTDDKTNLLQIAKNSTKISGKSSYLNSPYVTAGDRVYMVGHQNGSFPEIGWHVKGEMGGIWNHPIKLMDGFELELQWNEEIIQLDSAVHFINYPFANSHLYDPIGAEEELIIERFQFVPDGEQGLVIQYKLQNTSKESQVFDMIFNGHSDLMPVWLGERTGMIDGVDKGNYIQQIGAWHFKDSLNPWHLIFGADRANTGHTITKSPYSGRGETGKLIYRIQLNAQETDFINFTVAGSYVSEKDAMITYDIIQNNPELLLTLKKKRYEHLAKKSKLTVPDKKLQEAFEWLKYNCDWLIRDVPEIGRGITAGLPDYPWWFGVDSEYALQGYMAIGQSDIVLSSIKLIDSVSNAVNGNGKILHEMSTNGSVFNDGNINETPQFASLIWNIYLWNGDKSFLKKYFPTVKKGLKWLLEENDENKNLFPDGFGMMEIHGMDSEMIDVASYTYKAFKDASEIAQELEETTLALEYKEIALVLEKKINESFWSPDFESYADFLGTDQQALVLIEDAIIRADTLNKPWAISELLETKKTLLENPSKKLKPFVLHHNWVVNTPMEVGVADKEKALKALTTAEKFINPFGVFVTGIDRDESTGSDDGSFKGSQVFSYTGAVMTLPTGVLAIAENKYGRPDNALNYLKRMTRTFSYALPGSMYEVSPDYGMITQAWNIYSYAIPIVQQFFGILPKASEKRIRIKPQMPTEWQNASLENVEVSNNTISLFHSTQKNTKYLKVFQTNENWTLEVVLPKNENSSYKLREGDGQWESNNNEMIFTSKSPILKIEIINN